MTEPRRAGPAGRRLGAGRGRRDSDRGAGRAGGRRRGATDLEGLTGVDDAAGVQPVEGVHGGQGCLGARGDRAERVTAAHPVGRGRQGGRCCRRASGAGGARPRDPELLADLQDRTGGQSVGLEERGERDPLTCGDVAQGVTGPDDVGGALDRCSPGCCGGPGPGCLGAGLGRRLRHRQALSDGEVVATLLEVVARGQDAGRRAGAGGDGGQGVSSPDEVGRPAVGSRLGLLDDGDGRREGGRRERCGSDHGGHRWLPFGRSSCRA